ncbi:MAG: LytTR family DNA-binding domain-containing protein [Bacteroidales bacterium]
MTGKKIIDGKRVLWHLLFWAGTYGLYVLFFGTIYDDNHTEVISNLYLMPVRIGSTYFLAYVLMPALLFRKKYVSFLALMVPFAFLFGLAIWTVHYFFVFCHGCLLESDLPWFHLPTIFDRIVTNIGIPAVFALVVVVKKWYDDLQVRPRESSGRPESDYLSLNLKNGVKRIRISEIRCVESRKDYLTVHTDAGELTLKHTLSAFQERLPSERFLRIHRSYIVPVDGITGFSPSRIELRDRSLPLGSSYKHRVLEILHAQSQGSFDAG